MSLGKSKEEQELTALLANTLVRKEVLEPMAKIGWSHGTPPAPDYSGQPEGSGGAPDPAKAAAPGATSGPPASTQPGAPAAKAQSTAGAPVNLVAMFESLRDPANGLIMGKYPDVEAALKGAGHLANMAKQAYTERDALREENLKLRTAPAASPAAAPAPAPVALPSRAEVDAAQAKLDGVLSGIEQDGGVLDADAMKKISVAQRELADASSKFAVQAALATRDNAQSAEQDKWSRVNDFMSQNYPDAMKFTDEIGLHVQSDPLLQRAISALVAQGNEVEASVFAWKSFQAAHGSELHAKAVETEERLEAKGQVRKEFVDEARKDAGIVHGSAGGAGIHENKGAAGASREEIQAATEAMRREGEAPGSPAAMRFREMVIGRYLPESIFGPR